MSEAASLPLPGGRGPVAKASSVDLKLALQAKFGGKGYQIFFEVGDDTGTMVRRHADAVSVGIWPSTGHAIHGFEIKISRGDWLREMADPEKSQSIFQYCHRWSLVTPAGLVSADELPPGWGHYTFKEGRLREAVMPKRLEPRPLTPGFVAAIVRRAGERDNALLAEVYKKVREEEQGKLEAEVKRQVERELRTRPEKEQGASKLLESLEKELGFPIEAWDFKPAAHAIKAVRNSGVADSYAGLAGLMAELERARARIATALQAAGFEHLGGDS